MSQAKAIPIAPPANVPFKAAMVRQGNAAIAPDNSSQIGDVAKPSRASAKSAPALKIATSPVRIKARAVCAAFAISVSSFNISLVSEFALSGRAIVATQMLESMTASPAPTRAEASDVATAIYDGADAVMLSAESATGAFPAEAVEVMERIIRSTESHAFYTKAMTASREPSQTDADAIADTGATLACALHAKCIMAYSMSGLTGLRIAARRPKLPLIVMTRDQSVSRRMALVWGARSVLEATAEDYDSMVETARSECQRLLAPNVGDKMVVLSGVPFGQVGSTNNIRVATFR